MQRHHDRHQFIHPNGHRIDAKCYTDEGPGSDQARRDFVKALEAAGFRDARKLRKEKRRDA